MSANDEDDEVIVKNWKDTGVNSGDDLHDKERVAYVVSHMRHNMESIATAINATYALVRTMIKMTRDSSNNAQDALDMSLRTQNSQGQLDASIWGVPGRNLGAVGQIQESVRSIKKTMWLVAGTVAAPVVVACILGIITLIVRH